MPEKASAEMVSGVSQNTFTFFSAEQLAKAFFPMEVTLFGIVTFFS